MDTNKMYVNNFTKQLLMEDNKLIKGFLHNYECGEPDIENFNNLLRDIDFNRLGVPTEIQDVVDLFIDKTLYPMVYEPETVLKDYYKYGQIIDGVQHINNEVDAVEMCKTFLLYIHNVESAWDALAKEYIQPYLL